MQIVIIGGGISAVYIANRLIKNNCKVTIISKESYPPYDRIHLCSIVDDSHTTEDITLELDSNVNLILNEEIIKIDPNQKTIFSNTKSYCYHTLIIATGSQPKTLLDNTILNSATFRSVDDAYKIKDGIVDKNLLLVGVGPIGLELLDTISKIDTTNSITILSRGNHLYSKDLDISSVQLIQSIFEQNPKLKISFNDQIIDMKIESNQIKAVTTKKGTINNPFVIFGVGIEPNIDFAKKTLHTDRGILVNEYMQSSDENIYVVGEAAQIEKTGFIAGRVQECTMQCDVAFSHILKENVEFLHHVSIDALKVGSFLLADVTASDYNQNHHDNETILIRSLQNNRIDQYIINNNKLVKFIGINTNIDILHLQDLILNQKNIDPSYFYNNRLLSAKGRLICSCKPTHENDLVAMIQENCITTFSELRDYSDAGKVCGRCKQDIVNIINKTPVDPLQAQKIKEEKQKALERKKLQQVQKRIDKYNQLHPANKLDSSNLDAAINSLDMNKEYNKWISMITARLQLHPQYENVVSQTIQNLNKIPIIWLELSDCTGNSESFIKTANPTVEDLILNYISLDYHELLMAPSGDHSELSLDTILKNDAGKYILLVEGAVPLGMDGKYLRIGPKGETGIELLQRTAKGAAAIFSIGSCAYDGGVVAAGSNPTEAVGVAQALQRDDIINLPGCPTNPINIVGTLLHYMMFEELPKLDTHNRPLWAYQHRIHDNCERRGHYDNEEFVLEWGDDGAKAGWCLFKMGCKGPYANLNCSLVKFNEGTSWPVQSGHGCFGCGEGKIAFDRYTGQRELEEIDTNE